MTFKRGQEVAQISPAGSVCGFATVSARRGDFVYAGDEMYHAATGRHTIHGGRIEHATDAHRAEYNRSRLAKQCIQCCSQLRGFDVADKIRRMSHADLEQTIELLTKAHVVIEGGER